MKNLKLSEISFFWRLVCCIVASVAVMIYLFTFGGILPFLEMAEWVLNLDDLFHDRHTHALK